MIIKSIIIKIYKLIYMIMKIYKFIQRKLYFVSLMILLILNVISFTTGYDQQAITDYFIKNLLKDMILKENTDTWILTAYCPGPCCNLYKHGNIKIDYSNKVAAGNYTMKELMNAKINVVAVDPEIIPLGSILKFENKYYFALDTGGEIKGNRLDILVANHESTYEFGVKKVKNLTIFTPKNPKMILKKVKNYIIFKRLWRQQDFQQY